MPIPGGTLNTTTSWTTRVATALDLEVAPYLREEPIFRAFADSRPERAAHPGKVVTKTVRGELALATTPLSESLDVDAVAAPADRQFNITMDEYGNAMVDTHLLRKTDWSQAAAAEIGEEMGLNATRSVDKIYQNKLDAASNVLYIHATTGPTTTNPAASLGPVTAVGIQTAKTLLRRRNANPWFGTHSACVLHPDVLHDLMAETGTGSWRFDKENVDPGPLYNRVAGKWMGVQFVENSKCTITAGAPDVYNTYFPDKQSLIELVGDDVRIVVADPIDALKRFYRVGWYALLGVSVFRQNALQLLKTSSTIETGLFGGTLPSYDGKA